MINMVVPHKATGPNCVTVLHACDRRWSVVDGKLKAGVPRLTKLIGETATKDYDNASLFRPSAWQFECVEDFLELLAFLEHQPDACIIRGVLKPDHADRAEVLRRYAGHHGDLAMFKPADRQWLMVELDSIPCPSGVDPTDPLMAGGAARRALPAEFRSARTVSQLSSGAGRKPGLRVHLWFWLDRSISDAEAKRWLKAAPVDCAIYQPVQPHYTAAPIFEGVDDPCTDGRLAVLPGYAEVEVPPLPDLERSRVAFAPAEVRPYVAPSRGLGFKATRSEKYMLACVRGVAEATVGARHPTIVRVAACLYGLAKGGSLDPRDVEARILGAAVVNGLARENPEEVNAALRWAWEHAQPWRLP